MNKLFEVMIFSLLIGCATSRTIMGPNGKPAQSINCPRSIENCYEKASEVCPGGYKVLNSNDESSFIHNSYNGQITPYQRYNMFVECK